MACPAIAGSIRAGCFTEAGRYRPRRCTGPVDWAVAHTDKVSGSARWRPVYSPPPSRCRRAYPPPPWWRPAYPVSAPCLGVSARRRPPSGFGSAPGGVVCSATVLTAVPATAPRGHRRTELAEHEQVGVHLQVRDSPPLAAVGGQAEQFLVGDVVDERLR